MERKPYSAITLVFAASRLVPIATSGVMKLTMGRYAADLTGVGGVAQDAFPLPIYRLQLWIDHCPHRMEFHEP